MTDKPYYEERHAVMLRSWVLAQMMRGAFYALAFLFVIGVVLWAIYGLGLLLPEASKQAPPPMGWVIEAPADLRSA
jgi:hypothetical protein